MADNNKQCPAHLSPYTDPMLLYTPSQMMSYVGVRDMRGLVDLIMKNGNGTDDMYVSLGLTPPSHTTKTRSSKETKTHHAPKEKERKKKSHKINKDISERALSSAAPQPQNVVVVPTVPTPSVAVVAAQQQQQVVAPTSSPLVVPSPSITSPLQEPSPIPTPTSIKETSSVVPAAAKPTNTLRPSPISDAMDTARSQGSGSNNMSPFASPRDGGAPMMLRPKTGAKKSSLSFQNTLMKMMAKDDDDGGDGPSSGSGGGGVLGAMARRARQNDDFDF
eukprot:PhF_6_TR38745/c0_g1_i1/m.57999